ncbi:MAG: SDR family oxidoreductase [Oscillospiraceae bacterium]|jgi:NAD(P)-dependent dehydrogenase (short-subunit alcohol dehydrogenase family)|nr:SDR family oxidoreductase [Oscillospiraceae bacterium]
MSSNIGYLEYGFSGRTAIITGAGTGMGESCAIELAKGGAKVALFGRRTAPLEAVRAECLKYTDGAIALSVDVSDRDAVRAGVATVIETFGKVDILINNAGIESPIEYGHTPWELFETLEPEEYLRFFEIHTLGHYLMNLAVVPSMQANHFGRIVNITSVTGVDAGYSSPAYTASKAAAICQTKAFAKKYGADNITVNSVAPGMVNTPMKAPSPPEEFQAVADITPLGRVAEPIDIARVALFFAQENLFVSGQNLIVDGASHV